MIRSLPKNMLLPEVCLTLVFCGDKICGGRRGKVSLLGCPVKARMDFDLKSNCTVFCTRFGLTDNLMYVFKLYR